MKHWVCQPRQRSWGGREPKGAGKQAGTPRTSSSARDLRPCPGHCSREREHTPSPEQKCGGGRQRPGRSVRSLNYLSCGDPDKEGWEDRVSTPPLDRNVSSPPPFPPAQTLSPSFSRLLRDPSRRSGCGGARCQENLSRETQRRPRGGAPLATRWQRLNSFPMRGSAKCTV